MKSIAINSGTLRSKRGATVRRLLSPLLVTNHQAHVQQIGPGKDAFTLGALPIGAVASPSINPEQPRVPTKIQRLFLNYYETWRLGTDGDVYLLDRAYLHIHLTKPSQETKQLLSLHCDPCMLSSAQHYRYKRGPHLHIEGAEPSVDRAHISLCLHDDRLGGDTTQELTTIFGEAIRMIEKELFPCWERAARS